MISMKLQAAAGDGRQQAGGVAPGEDVRAEQLEREHRLGGVAAR